MPDSSSHKPGTRVAPRPSIVVLPPEIASRIAAGEVIERPASVVKELVENSLDAGARRVSVLLEDGGRDLVEVSDDGEGMTAEEALLAVERHATSKISSAEDLFRITTYGFRGEALPSIASVSEFELITRPRHSEEGTRVLIRAGVTVKHEPAGAPPGTTVRVSRLFESVPARRKFLKSAQTELARSLDFVQRLALARPDVSFLVRHGEQESFSHPGGDVITALVSVFGRQVARELIPAEAESVLSLRAFLAPPTRTRPNRSQQYLFVNGRPISSRLLSHAVDEAYAGLLPHGRFPIVVVLLDVPPDLVDVNVHPRKAEVKFVREREAHSLVFHTLREALVGKGLVPRVAPSPAGPALVPQGPGFSFEPAPQAVGGGWLQRDPVPPPDAHRLYAPPEQNRETPGPEPVTSLQPESSHIADQRLDPSRLRILGQVAGTYIVVETPQGLAIIDQHVAHERVLYERFRSRSSVNPVQMLAVPVTLELSRREAGIVMERLKEFADLGFVLEQFGPEAVLLRGVPAGLKLSDVEQTVRDMLSEVVELTLDRKMLAPREAVVTSAACKAAVKAGDRMSEPEMRSLIEQLLRCDNPYVCPHGRPIMVRLDRESLEKIFQR